MHSIFTVNAPILYLSCYKIWGENVIQFSNKKKDNGNPIHTSMVVPVRGVA
jgi:hypothetical protein